MKIILASGSPRRKEILQNLGLQFEVVVPDVKEKLRPYFSLKGEKVKFSFREQIKNIAFEKALAARDKLVKEQKNQGDYIIIACDTMVCFNGQLIGKPKDMTDAKKMLIRFSGKQHSVISGLAVLVYRNGQNKKYYLQGDISHIKFRKLSEHEIDSYLSSGDPILTLAGGYAVQGNAWRFVDRINGNYYNIVGIPTNKLIPILQKEGVL